MTLTETEREPEDAFVDYGDLGIDPNADTVLIEAPKLVRTERAPYASDFDWATYFRERREEFEARKRGFHAGGDPEVVDRGHPIPAADLPKPARALAERVGAAGWEVACQCSIVYVTPTLFVEAKEGEHNAGDVRWADHDDWCYAVQARLQQEGRTIAAFWACWTRKEAVGKKPTTGFKGATYRDIVEGMPFFTKTLAEFEEWLAILVPEA